MDGFELSWHHVTSPVLFSFFVVGIPAFFAWLVMGNADADGKTYSFCRTLRICLTMAIVIAGVIIFASSFIARQTERSVIHSIQIQEEADILGLDLRGITSQIIDHIGTDTPADFPRDFGAYVDIQSLKKIPEESILSLSEFHFFNGFVYDCLPGYIGTPIRAEMSKYPASKHRLRDLIEQAINKVDIESRHGTSCLNSLSLTVLF